MSRIRIGTVGYLNSEPLTRFLDPERFELVADHPRGIAERLASGDVVLALAPVASVLSDGDLRIVPGWCIGADGPVSSVLLVAETPPEAWTEVVLDGESRTSVTLARLLMSRSPLRERLAGPLPVRTVAPGASVGLAVGTTAAVVIGDAARRLPERLGVRLDLAELWSAWTGLPFVFAVWAGRPDAPQEAIDAVREVGTRGVVGLEDRYDGADLAYLTQSIRYPLDERAMVGLRRYAALAFAEGLIGTEHVRLFGPRRVPRVVEPALAARLAEVSRGGRLVAEELATMLRALPAAELQAAAAARRRLIGDERQATYLIGATVDATSLTEEAVATLEGTAAACLLGLGELSVERQVGVLAAVAARGVQAAAPSVDELAWSARLGGVPVGVRLGVLRAAGLHTVCWNGEVGGAQAALEASSQGLRVRVVLTIAEQEAPERWAARLQRVRDAIERGLQVGSVVVRLPLPEGSLVAPGAPTTARWLTAVATARLFFDEGVHIEASPETQGLELSQLALFVGADDLGMVGPHALPASKGEFSLDVEQAERLLRVAGFEPVRRDLDFTALGGPLTRMRKVRRPEERAEP
jgi:predicted solute-binding protein